MRVPVPEYIKPIASTAGELVMSTPSWYGEHGPETSLFVDARTWPPELVRHPYRVSAAARLPDGRWVCVARREGVWCVCWFDSIRAAVPSRREPVPFEASPPEPDDTDDDGPILHLHAFGAVLLATPARGPVHVHAGDAWAPHPTLRREARESPRSVQRTAGPVLEWGGALYDTQFGTVDAQGCTQFVRVTDGPLLAMLDRQLVEVRGDELVPHLADHEVSEVEPGPRGTALLSLARDTERGTHYAPALYDPHAQTLAMLPEEPFGAVRVVALTGAQDIVLHDESEHVLFVFAADDVAALPRISVAALPVPPKLDIHVFDEVGASARSIVATTADAILIALGHALRFHTVDAPATVVELAQPIVAVAARAGRFAAIELGGVLHTYTATGTLLGSRAMISAPRSLTATPDAWVIVCPEHVVLVEEQRTRVLEVADPLAAAADPDGVILIACADRRIFYDTGEELRELPPTIEQIVAVAALGPRRFACVGVRNLYQLHVDEGELVPLDRRLRRAHLATIPDGRIATCSSPGAVEVDDFDGERLVSVPTGHVRYSSYSAPEGAGDITVRGLAFMDDGRLVIVLDEGRGNILTPDTGATLKLDPQPGDEPSRWIFFCGGQILIAG